MYCAINTVMGVISVLSYVQCSLIFSPLSMHKGGGDKVSVLNLCINAKSMWLVDDLPWSHSDHFIIFIGCACCIWLACVLLAESDLSH